MAETHLAQRAPASDGRVSAAIARFQWWILGGIVLLAAASRVQQLSDGSLYRDDAWVVLTNRVPLSTAVRMVSTTPLYTLFIREWTSLAPHSTWFAQLPNLIMSLAAIVGIFALLRWERLPSWIALSGAFLLAISQEATDYAAHVKPYSLAIVTTTLLLFLGERVRRSTTSASLALLTVASILVAAISYTSAIVVVGIFAVIVFDELAGGALDPRTVVAGGVVGLGLLIIYWLIHKEISYALVVSWEQQYIHLGSASHAERSLRHALEGIGHGIGLFPRPPSLRLLGDLEELVLGVLFVIGVLTAYRRQAISIAVLAFVVLLAVVHKVPIGTDRTDTYFYPCLILVMASGLLWLSARIRTMPHPVQLGAIALSLIVMAALAVLSIQEAVPYPGSNIKPAVQAIRPLLNEPGTIVVVEGTARWPWTYYEEPRVHLIFGEDFNTGFTPISSLPNVIISPHTNKEPGYHPADIAMQVRNATRVVTLNYADTTGLTDWLGPALLSHCWVVTSHHEYGLFIVNVLERNPDPFCTPR